jgi:hypothetical protein
MQNPADIPEEGRYDFTFLKQGYTKDKFTGEKVYVAHFLIDNGPYTGKRVSTTMGSLFEGLKPRISRRSAYLHVRERRKKGRIYYRYSLSDFEYPEEESTITLNKNKKERFSR